MKFNKPAVSIRHQLAIMESRGLAIKDRTIAERNLRFIGYFRLSGLENFVALKTGLTERFGLSV